jgi:hypothetical protein
MSASCERVAGWLVSHMTVIVGAHHIANWRWLHAGEILNTMDKLMTRTWQVQLEAAVCFFYFPLFLTLLPLERGQGEQ